MADYVYQPYPKAIYRAASSVDPQVECLIVHSADERERAERQGFVVGGPAAARARIAQLEEDVANAAAEVCGAAQRMTETARAEYAAQERASEDHVVDVVPAKRRPKAAKVTE